ncbi:beta-ketoacyl synthase N-terminal-like domain-containing protein [Pontibacter sp. BT731]|uniref:beta-ketoacyl synthase N-terminal-like domain-containing protein n=1 Tax=Pontibacter coccineus TaxID=3063328 RepID=UPI0026E1F987|nr:beta-ketoacyl synthase N-terminal-like domain-containing protein [Pontibacter sp. BT731]MDO6391610.1 beta-ketoacyl synthase N-terminal-like domain-containing protein [Pontibacter sp. BT731]
MESAKEHIVIRGCGAISPLGIDEQSTAQAYFSGRPGFSIVQHQGQATPVAALSEAGEEALQKLQAETPTYRQLDRSVLMAIYAARQAAEQAGWLNAPSEPQQDLAVNIGSSRGATGLFEQHYEAFQQQRLSASASPTTTLGNLSSWVGHAVNAGGAQISHSITCSTALMAVANGIAWLRAGMASRFLAGGTEAPLTDFTIAQMKAIGIYSSMHDQPFPCQPYGISGENTFVLGEGAAVLALEKVTASQLRKGDVIIEAVGFGFEQIQSKTGISADGLNFQQSMRHALSQLESPANKIDAIITHSPGTKAGDKAELSAIEAIFKSNPPAITTNKHLLGHTLGASGALSLQYALHLLDQQKITLPDYPLLLPPSPLAGMQRLMINAAGFGGNAASITLCIV